MGYAARLRIARAVHADKAGDVLPWEFVRLVTGSGLGIVESISGDHATCIDLARPGHREILPLSILMRADGP